MKTALLSVGGFPVMAELAETPEEQARGLMGRRKLPDGHGMLFLYGRADQRTFWMKDTLIPLDLAYIVDGKIVTVHPLSPLDEQGVSGYADMALEVPAGWFGDHGVGPGHAVQTALVFGEVGNG
jgi:uncharacterized membrane protein (UPF0127 family)